MTVEVKIDLFGDLAFRHRLQNLADSADNMSPANERIRDEMMTIIEEQFATEGARSGNKWARLSFSTIKQRGTDHPILIDKADLLLRVTDPESFHVTDEGVFYEPGGAADEYGQFHQTGTSRMPQRKIVDFTDMDQNRFIEKLEDHLFGGPLRFIP